MKYITTIDEQEYEVEVVDEHHVRLGDRVLTVDLVTVSGQPVYSLILDGSSYEAYVQPVEDVWQVLLRGRLYPATVEDEREKRLRAAAGGTVSETGEYMLRAPMPGLIVAVPVTDGQTVSRGEVLVILESMKMQNELRAPREGVVARIRVRPGDSVEQKKTLLSVL